VCIFEAIDFSVSHFEVPSLGCDSRGSHSLLLVVLIPHFSHIAFGLVLNGFFFSPILCLFPLFLFEVFGILLSFGSYRIFILLDTPQFTF